MLATEDIHESDVPRQRLGDRFVLYLVRLLKLDQKAADAVEAWLEGRKARR
jgi:hypothetical protein